MSSNLESKTKKELVEIIDQLSNKLKEMTSTEEKIVSLEEDLPGVGFSIVRGFSKERAFSLVKLSYNCLTKAAKVTEVKELDTNDFAVALYKAKEYLVNHVLVDSQLAHTSRRS